MPINDVYADIGIRGIEWKPILWLSLTQTSSGVCHQNSVLIVTKWDPTKFSAFAFRAISDLSESFP